MKAQLDGSPVPTEARVDQRQSASPANLMARAVIDAGELLEREPPPTFGFLQGRSGYEPDPETRWTRWGTVSSGFHEIEIGWDRLESVGLLAPFLAPAFSTRPSHDQDAPLRAALGPVRPW